MKFVLLICIILGSINISGKYWPQILCCCGKSRLCAYCTNLNEYRNDFRSAHENCHYRDVKRETVERVTGTS
jgi:hypothetical protein